MATAAVNAAVSMRSLSAPSVDKSYISLDSSSTATDEDGLPLTYDKDLIEAYWRKERGALNRRWSYFVGKAVPFLTRLVTLFISEGKIDERHVPGLSRQARLDLQDLGPTFIKAGQMMSVRPDVLPQATLDELTKLQDSVVMFDTAVAVCVLTWSPGGEGRLPNVRTIESPSTCPPPPRHLITKLKGSTESHFCTPRFPPSRRVPLAEKISKGFNAVATRGRRSRPL
jgi:hypothetical protein